MIDLGIALGGTYCAAAFCFYLAMRIKPSPRKPGRRYYERPPRNPNKRKVGW